MIPRVKTTADNMINPLGIERDDEHLLDELETLCEAYDSGQIMFNQVVYKLIPMVFRWYRRERIG